MGIEPACARPTTDKPAIGEPATVEVRRSAWRVEIGPFRLAHHRTVRRVIGDAAPPQSRLVPRTIGVGAVALLAVAAPVWLTQAHAVDGGGYAVSQTVPERRRPAAIAVRRPFGQAHARRHVAAAPAASDAPLDGDQAVAAAWRTGEPQEWAARGAYGIVVPGAIERADGFACRSLARLTRHPGVPDTVERSRRCSAGGGEVAVRERAEAEAIEP